MTKVVDLAGYKRAQHERGWIRCADGTWVQFRDWEDIDVAEAERRGLVPDIASREEPDAGG